MTKTPEDKIEDKADGMKEGEDSSASGADADKAKLDEQSTFTREEVEALAKTRAGEMMEESIQERLARDRKTREQEADEAKRVEREAQLAKNQEFETLSQEQAARITEQDEKIATLTAELETSTANGTTLTTTLTEAVDAEIEALGLPDHYTVLVSKMTVIEKRDWITKYGDEFRKTSPRGVSPTPKGGQVKPGTPTEADKNQQSNFISGIA